MSTTLHITAKLKAGITSGMRVSGTLVAVNAAGISFPQYYGSPPQSGTAATIVGQMSVTDVRDMVAIIGTAGFSPLQAGHLTDVMPTPTSASAVWITSRGAVSSSTATDSLAAIRNAISAAALLSHKTVFVPAGDYAYSGTITASAVSIVGVGPTSILRATNWTNRSIWLKGSSAGLKNVQLVTNGVVDRQAPWEYAGVILNGCINFTCENIYITPMGGTGFQTIASAGPGIINRCTISGTLADSIHMTDEAHHITVTLNRIMNSGDDGIACVSYSYDGGKVKNIEAAFNWVSHNLFGRGMTVVGGQDINYHNNLITSNSTWAGMLVAQEISFESYGCNSISFTYNTIINCGSDGTGHAGIFVLSDGTYTGSSISIVRNDIQSDGTSRGIRYYGPHVGLVVNSNKITGASQNYLSSGSATVTLYTSGNVGYPYTTP